MSDLLDTAALTLVLAAVLTVGWSWQATVLAVLAALGLHGMAVWCQVYRR